MDAEPRGASDVLLTDGRIASIRPLASADRAELIALHDRAGDDSIRRRFFTSGHVLAHRYVDRLYAVRPQDIVALVAAVSGHVVGLVGAERIGPDAAEVAMLVADAEHGHGVGSLLLEHAAAACRDRGIHRLHAEVLAENGAMLRVLLDAGFDLTRRTDHGVVVVEMSTEATARALEAADRRERASEARSLHPLLYPRAVALAGVRRSGGGLGHAVLRAIVDGGFTGELHLVHPAASSIDGITAFRHFTDVPARVDLAIVTVPAQEVLETLEDAAEAAIPAAVVISSGFSELNSAGATVQQRMLSIARARGLRLVGPNCMGVISNSPDIRLNATFTDSVPPAGGLAVASQSGGIGIALLDTARELGVGVHAFVSLGNKADVSGNDLLCAWYDDPQVTATALYLESFGNARKFARVARSFASRKPLMAVVGGRSTSGSRAGASHTSAAATPAAAVDALLAQAGVIPCRSAESMARTALLLQEQPLPTGRRIGVVSNAGGLGVLAVDAAEAEGLQVPEFSPGLRAQLASHLRITAGTSNPVDLGAGATADDVTHVVQALLGSTEIDLLLLVVVPTTVAPATPLVEALGRLGPAYGEKAAVLVGLGGLGAGAGRVTVYHAVDHAIDAIGHAVRYAEWLRIPPSDPPRRDVERADAARALAQKLAGAADVTTRWLSFADAVDVLRTYGLAPVGEIVASPTGAAEAASRISFPVALKVADPEIVHKTDRGLVHLGLGSASAVVAAATDISAALGDALRPLLVQPMLEGVEIALGVSREQRFGPLVMVAAGGVATAVLDDRTFLVPPISQQDAARAIRSLRAWPLLEGYRGSPAVDLTALERMIVALGQLARDVPQLAELDLNPVVCSAQGAVVVDAKVGLARSAVTGDDLPRQLSGRS